MSRKEDTRKGFRRYLSRGSSATTAIAANGRKPLNSGPLYCVPRRRAALVAGKLCRDTAPYSRLLHHIAAYCTIWPPIAQVYFNPHRCTATPASTLHLLPVFCILYQHNALLVGIPHSLPTYCTPCRYTAPPAGIPHPLPVCGTTCRSTAPLAGIPHPLPAYRTT